MTTFKVGDKVRCIQKSFNGYPGIVGKVYEVKDAIDQHTGYGHIVLITDEPCANLGCQNNRFELVTQDQLDKADAALTGVVAGIDAMLDAASAKSRAIGGEDKGYVPDKIDWDKHKQYMRNL